jgi:hypothetical protein
MNAKVFKSLIKEAVREAVREELGLLLLEQKKQSIKENLNSDNSTLSFNTKDVDVISLRSKLKSQLDENFGIQQPQPSLSNNKNPFASFLEDSAASMTPQELSGLKNLG